MAIYSFNIKRLFRLSERLDRGGSGIQAPGHSIRAWSSVSRIGVSKNGSSSKNQMKTVSEEQQKRHVFNALL